MERRRRVHSMGSSSPLVWVISCTIGMVIMADQYFLAAASMEFKAGGDTQGWQQPPQNETNFYSQWAARNRFHVGDSIRFEYNNDSVLVVNKYDYYHCNSSDPIAAYHDGNTIILLDKPGPVYFISGNFTRCRNGQKIDVDVMANRSEVYPPPPSIAYPPESFGPIAPSPSTTTSTSGSPAAAPANCLVFASFMVVIIAAAAAARIDCGSD